MAVAVYFSYLELASDQEGMHGLAAGLQYVTGLLWKEPTSTRDNINLQYYVFGIYGWF